MNNIYLIGMMGSGKTIVAKALAHELMRHVEDIDARIVEKEGRTITTIFADSGEAYFRNLEKKMLQELAAQSRIVVATGGGIVLDPENIDSMRATGSMVYLKAPTDVLFDRIKENKDRPLLLNASPKDTLDALYLKRHTMYEKADHTVDTTGKKPFDIAGEIMELLDKEGKL
jgi:shikimate kinase